MTTSYSIEGDSRTGASKNSNPSSPGMLISSRNNIAPAVPISERMASKVLLGSVSILISDSIPILSIADCRKGPSFQDYLPNRPCRTYTFDLRSFFTMTENVIPPYFIFAPFFVIVSCLTRPM